MIKLQHVNKVYTSLSRNTPVLHDINLEISRGEFIAVLGASGSGKTTLMNIIGLLDKVTSGSYMLHGKDVESYTQDELADVRNSKIGFIFQNFSLLNQYPVWYNVALPLHYRNQNLKEIKKQACNYLDKVGLLDFADAYPNTLSGGQQQRVSCARALVVEPDIILADEPTGALDSETGKKLMDFFEYLNSSYNTTILLITHDANVASCTTRKIVLNDGRIITG
ncbi:MAG: ABC transporter ATP-binding protein [Legionellales bacterium]|nr:ABC transporter ATP-binding protein [Legionellales bacterium]